MPENNNSSDNNSAGDPSAPEKRCASCGRPESAAGKLIKMPNDMNVCQDCMKRSVEMLGNMWGDMDSMFGMKEPEPEKKEESGKNEDEDSIIKLLKDFRSLPQPHEIKAMLDEYVVGQEEAKKVISVAVYNHYKRLSAKIRENQEIEELQKKKTRKCLQNSFRSLEKRILRIRLLMWSWKNQIFSCWGQQVPVKHIL